MFEQITKLKKTERVLFVLSAILFVFCIFGLYKYKDYFFQSVLKKEDAIAVILNSEGNTRKRNPEKFGFETIRKADYLGNGDYLYSGAGSQILLQFIKGPRLLIGEQSLVVLREVGGAIDLKVQEGALSGSFDEMGELEIMTDQESVIINGDAGAQFSVSYSSIGGLEVGSYKSPIKIQFEGKTTSLQDQAARIKKNQSIKVADNKSAGADGKEPEFKDIEQADKQKEEQQNRVPAGMEFETPKQKERVNIDPPYPKENHVFIHTKGGSVSVYPKALCDGNCELSILINGAPAVSKKFERGAIPIVFVKIDPSIEGDVEWEFTDGSEKLNGRFYIRKNIETNFKEFFNKQYPIEVMD